jgi:hypothetical protein
MKYANQDKTLREYTEWMEEVISLFEDLSCQPQKFFPITKDLLDPLQGNFRR